MPVLSGTSARSARTLASEDWGFARAYHKAVQLPEGIAMIVGGQTDPGAVAATTPVVFQVLDTDYDAQGRRSVDYQWEDLAHVLTVEQQAFGVSTVDDRTIITGGYDGSAGSPTTAYDILRYRVSPAANSLTSGVMTAARALHAQASFSGKVMVCGGATVIGTQLASTSQLNLDTLVWSTAGTMKFSRQQHQAVAISTGVLVMGGRQPTVSATKIINTAEIWDGTTTWSQVGSMTYARYNFAAVALPNDRVLVIGGTGYNPSQSSTPATLRSCEIWDARTNFWYSVQDMAIARDFPSAAYVPALNAVVVGGGRSPVVEILDLATMTWKKSLGALDEERYLGQVVHLTEDLVLFAGGIKPVASIDTSTAHNYVFIPGSEVLWQGGLNRMVAVDAVVDSNTFTYLTPDFDGITENGPYDQVVHKFAATANDPDLLGPYIFDPKEGIAITSTEGLTNQLLEAGRQYTTLTLQSGGAAAFPDEEGWLVFNFGEKEQIWPVKYLGRISSTELALDASFVFPFTVPLGDTVHLASQRTPFAPVDEDLNGLYLTDSPAGRIAAEAALEDTIAAGFEKNIEIVFPGDRGIGGEGFPTTDNYKVSDIVRVFDSE